MNRQTPGFLVDVQVNGRWLGGVCCDFSSPSLTEAQALAVINEALSCGTFICPTTITQPFEQQRRNVSIIAGALAEAGMIGRWQHIEGPFFADTAALGAHPREHIRRPEIALLDALIEASNDTIALLTVGADVPDICPLIEAARARGIVVSLGHHCASPTQVREAQCAGASQLTHLYNGIPLEVRRQGILDYQLDCFLGAMVIPDGAHVEDYCLHLVLRVKGADNVIAVSDQSALSGAPLTPEDSPLDLWGKPVWVIRHPHLETCIIRGSNKMLAGSWANMLWCMNHLARLFGSWRGSGESWDDDGLWRVGCLNPLRLLGKTAEELAAVPHAEIQWEGARFVRLPAGESW